MTASITMAEPADPRGPLDARGRAIASLRRVYGEHLKPAQRMADAIRAEIPGGDLLMDAIVVVNGVSQWDENAFRSVTSHLHVALSNVQTIPGDIGPLLTNLKGALRLAQALSLLSDPEAVGHTHDALRITLNSARDLAAELVIERHAKL